MVWRLEDPQGNESGKIVWELPRWTRGRVLDIGCGPSKAFPHFIGIDNCIDTKLFGIQMKPDIWIEDACDLRLFGTAAYDAVYSSHTLEHIAPERVEGCLREWWRVLKVGGFLVLYLPHEDLYPKCGEPGANPDHKWNVNEERLLAYMRKVGSWDCRVLEQRNEGYEYSLFSVFEKLAEPERTESAVAAFEWRYSHQLPKPKKTAAVVRYGAYGDILQASSVFAGLKAAGYHVTVFCSPPGCEVIQHDPNIDDFYYQDVDQVPNQHLGLFWEYQSKKFDKWVQLSESAEGTLLPIPGRFLYAAPPKVRHKMCDHNYLEFQHMCAGLPHVPRVNFFPTLAEVKWAQAQRAVMGKFVLVWALAGSSVHKVWPYIDTIFTRALIQFPDVHIVMVGGPAGVIIEQGWFKAREDGQPVRDEAGFKVKTDPRVWPMSGQWGIRQTLAFVQQADLIAGPETGVLNAVANAKMPKVVLLSHSTVENLTRDWVNTHSITAPNVTCPGRGNNEAPACHRLHYTWEHCRQADDDETGQPMGIAQCQKQISADDVWNVIEPIIREKLG